MVNFIAREFGDILWSQDCARGQGSGGNALPPEAWLECLGWVPSVARTSEHKKNSADHEVSQSNLQASRENSRYRWLRVSSSPLGRTVIATLKVTVILQLTLLVVIWLLPDRKSFSHTLFPSCLILQSFYEWTQQKFHRQLVKKLYFMVTISTRRVYFTVIMLSPLNIYFKRVKLKCERLFPPPLVI